MRAAGALDRTLVPAAARTDHVAQLDHRRGEQRVDLEIGMLR